MNGEYEVRIKEKFEFPLIEANELAIDIITMRASGMITMRPWILDTVCESAITFLDGEKGLSIEVFYKRIG